MVCNTQNLETSGSELEAESTRVGLDRHNVAETCPCPLPLMLTATTHLTNIIIWGGHVHGWRYNSR